MGNQKLVKKFDWKMSVVFAFSILIFASTLWLTLSFFDPFYGSMISLGVVLMLALNLTCWALFMRKKRAKFHGPKDYTISNKSDSEYKQLACYDTLTKLANRMFFHEILDKAVAHAQRHQESLALIYLDMDNFKRINDSLGHDAGDLLLQLASKRIIDCMRKEDVVARLGGDEFSILLNDIKSAQDAADTCERVIKTFSFPFVLFGNEVYVGTSLGIALYPQICNSTKELIQNADMAMYRAKQQGKGRYRFFTQEFDNLVKRKHSVEKNLHSALKNKEYELVYQPQYDYVTKSVKGMEALIRWKNSELGYVSPAEFIPIAEDIGLIVEIGTWVMDTAFIQMRDMLKAEPQLMQDIHMSVNFSAIQFEQHNMSQIILKSLSDYAIPAENVTIEITETALLKNYDATSNTLDELFDNGLAVSLDDFGTGYSSISLLRHRAVKQIKIDSSFVQDVQINPDSAKLISGLVQLSKELDLNIVAEGVETAMQIRRLINVGCSFVQGYHCSRPLSSEKLLPFIKEQNSKASHTTGESEAV